MSTDASQQTPQQSVLVITDDDEQAVLEHMDSLGIVTTVRVKRVSAADFCGERLAMLLDDVDDHHGPLYVNDSPTSRKLRLCRPGRRIVALTERPPAEVRMPAINVYTGATNF